MPIIPGAPLEHPPDAVDPQLARLERAFLQLGRLFGEMGAHPRVMARLLLDYGRIGIHVAEGLEHGVEAAVEAVRDGALRAAFAPRHLPKGHAHRPADDPLERELAFRTAQPRHPPHDGFHARYVFRRRLKAARL